MNEASLQIMQLLGILSLTLIHREALLAEMGVAMREDGGTVGVFSPKKVRKYETSPKIRRDLIFTI